MCHQQTQRKDQNLQSINHTTVQVEVCVAKAEKSSFLFPTNLHFCPKTTKSTLMKHNVALSDMFLHNRHGHCSLFWVQLKILKPFFERGKYISMIIFFYIFNKNELGWKMDQSGGWWFQSFRSICWQEQKIENVNSIWQCNKSYSCTKPWNCTTTKMFGRDYFSFSVQFSFF